MLDVSSGQGAREIGLFQTSDSDEFSRAFDPIDSSLSEEVVFGNKGLAEKISICVEWLLAKAYP